MSRLYGNQHRRLQQQFETEALADRVEDAVVKTTISEHDRAFLQSRDMFFLSTVDQTGRPTVSYKGGDPGFVKVTDDKTLVFPSYDGNGMFFSMGNIVGNPKLGLLFIDFEVPNRVRIQGHATVSSNDPMIENYVEADLIVRVTISEIWTNCPRYVHTYKKAVESHYIPRRAVKTPFAEWKRIDALQDVLPPRDQGRTGASGGTITMKQWAANTKKGKG